MTERSLESVKTPCGCATCLERNMAERQVHKHTILTWDECFAKMAKLIAQRSKDPNTQAGAVVVSGDNIVFGLGYNGFPRGIESNGFPWIANGDFLETKYAYVVHAEANAIYNSNTSVRGCKIYCTLFPCNECAKTIIQVGIKEVIFECDKHHDRKFSIASRKLFDAAGVTYRQFHPETLEEKS